VNEETEMLRKIILSVIGTALGALLTPSEAGAYGAAHVGYTHVGPGGVYHTGRTVAAGPGGVYAGGHTTAVGGYGAASGGYRYSPSYYGGGAVGGVRVGGAAVGGVGVGGAAVGGVRYGYIR